MHFENEKEMNSNTKYAAASPTSTTTSATSCTSSADSGVIIIDNESTININNRTHNKNNKESDKEKTILTIDKENNVNDTSKIKKFKHADEQSMKNNNININQSNKNNSNRNLNASDIFHTKSDNSKDPNRDASKKNSVNIENIINITKPISKSNNSNVNTGESHKWDPAPQSTASRQNSLSRSPSKNCSPTVSIRSTTISIISMDENAIDSSVIDSDSDFDIASNSEEGVHSNFVLRKLGQQTTYPPNSPDIPKINKGLTVISQKITPNGGVPAGPGTALAENILNGGLCPPGAGSALTSPTPQIGSIALSNSTDVTFGDKHFYEGPVTIQQFLIDSRDKWKPDEEHGNDNPTFTQANGTKKSSNQPGAPFKVNCPTFPQEQHEQAAYKFIFNRRAVIITGSIIGFVILLGILIVFMTDILDVQKKNNFDNDFESGADTNGSLKFVTRAEWGALPAKEGLEKLDLPVQRVIISHTATDICKTTQICSIYARNVQAFHMSSQGWSDIGYNFLIGGDGKVYIGRGWNYMGAHTKGYNRNSIGVSFIGTYVNIEPTKGQLKATQLLLEEGVRQKKISPDYQLYGARQLSATESPGEVLYKIIQRWPHWSAEV